MWQKHVQRARELNQSKGQVRIGSNCIRPRVLGELDESSVWVIEHETRLVKVVVAFAGDALR